MKSDIFYRFNGGNTIKLKNTETFIAFKEPQATKSGVKNYIHSGVAASMQGLRRKLCFNTTCENY